MIRVDDCFADIRVENCFADIHGLDLDKNVVAVDLLVDSVLRALEHQHLYRPDHREMWFVVFEPEVALPLWAAEVVAEEM